MSRSEKDYFRDLTYSLWHRSIEPESSNRLPYVDVDAVEVCPDCKEPLALIETARDKGQPAKPVGVLRALARRANLPAYLVFYRPGASGGIESFRLRQVWPPSSGSYQQMSPEQYIRFLWKLRAGHFRQCRGSPQWGGSACASEP